MVSTIHKHISLEKKYNFPSNLKIIYYGEKILIIAIDVGNWLVLENEMQLYFFNLLKENQLGKSIEIFNGNKIDAEKVVTQIEAKQFERINISRQNLKK